MAVKRIVLINPEPTVVGVIQDARKLGEKALVKLIQLLVKQQAHFVKCYPLPAHSAILTGIDSSKRRARPTLRLPNTV